MVGEIYCMCVFIKADMEQSCEIGCCAGSVAAVVVNGQYKVIGKRFQVRQANPWSNKPFMPSVVLSAEPQIKCRCCVVQEELNNTVIHAYLICFNTLLHS